jgi:UDP-N-acetylglucosamine diphosphorylase/glucosamine-1-phosphate N-acetyltransferase
MARTLVVFEDDGFFRLYPLTLMRPAWDLTCGILRLKEKLLWGLRRVAIEKPEWREFAGDRLDIRFHLRGYLAGGYRGAVHSYDDIASHPGLVSLVNGRLVFERGITDHIDPSWEGKYVHAGNLVWANLPAERLKDLAGHVGSPIGKDLLAGLPTQRLEANLISRPWGLVKQNGKQIELDFSLLGGAMIESAPPSGVHLIGEDRMRIGRSVKISPGVVIDASRGPVSIDSDVVVMANAALQGPLHIGRGSIVKMGGMIYGETTIGPVCKVGGEVGESVFQGYANKQHGGFVGHSYLCEWVNLGAGTDTSDMKNNYSTIKVGPPGQETDTGELFLGLFMGDHSKSGIGTVFNTGSVVGVCCNVFGAGYPPKFIPSFSWGGSGGFVDYDLEKAIKTAAVVMARRDKALSPHGESALRKIYEITTGERDALIGS